MTRQTSLRGSNRKIVSKVETNRIITQQLFVQSHDVHFRQITFNSGRRSRKVLFIFSAGMTDMDNFQRAILPSFNRYFMEHGGRLSAQTLAETLPLVIESTETFYESLPGHIFRGMMVFFVDGIDKAYVVNLSDPPKRSPEEPGSEVSIRGPKDGFVEELDANIALVRKRLPTDSLCIEQFTVGVRTTTRVSLLYMRDIIDPNILEEVRTRIQSIYTDGLYASSQLEEFLVEEKFVLVPKFAYSGRPDFTSAALLRGRFALLVDGTPTAILGPVNLPFLFQSAEDEYMLYPFLIVQRSLRFVGALVSVFVPGLYVAIVGYHIDRVPLSLLGTFVTARHGVPFPTPVEAIIMLLLFEMLREAGNRLPGGLGQTLPLVGGLIIGDAAIETGLASATILVVTGATAVASFTISNQSLAGSLTIFRIFILLISSVLGEFGFLVGSFVILVYLSTIRSFGVPYFSPFSPLSFPDLKYTFTSVVAHQKRWRPSILRAKDKSRG